jgi:aspartate-semialdehyde dehydrogenase
MAEEMTSKIKVGILGATGTIGQRFVQLLENHPWFEVTALAASERSVGKNYEEVVNWKLSNPIPDRMRSMAVLDAEPGFEATIVFSGLDAKVAGGIEEKFAKEGYAVISNSKNHRMDDDVPILLPEINADHLGLIEIQRARRGYEHGFIVTNSNCSTMTLCLALAPIEREFGIESVIVTTLQAVSGAGYPGVPSLDIVGNVIPFIGEEEEKIERETRKILGHFQNGKVEMHPMSVSATTTRVPVVDGHTESVNIKLRKKASLEEVKGALQSYTSLPQKLQLPSAPQHPVILKEELDRPQPRLDVNLEKGMATVVGRVRPCTIMDYKFVILGHNTIRGAAGAAILNAELLKAKGYF